MPPGRATREDVTRGEGDFDPSNLSPWQMGAAIMQEIEYKGFCSMQLGLKQSLLHSVHGDIRKLDRAGKLEQPAAEVSAGLLDQEGSARFCKLDSPELPDEELETGHHLRALDLALEEIYDVMEPHFANLGINPSSRSPGWLLETGAPSAPNPELNPEDAVNWFKVFARQILMVIVFLGPSRGKLEMTPFRDDVSKAYSIETMPGQMVIIRADALMHSHTAPETAFAVCCFYLQACTIGGARAVDGPLAENLSPVAQYLSQWIEERLEALKREELTGGTPDMSAQWRLAMNHMFSKANSVGCNGVCTRLPQGWHWEDFLTSSLPGCDAAAEVPRVRWDNSLVPYTTIEGAPKTAPPRHGCWVEGIELFDNKFFIISTAEASSMAPEQRMNLECSYEALHMAGHTKSSLMNSFTAFYSANSELDWGSVEKKICSTANAGAAQHTSISSARCSFCLGCRGPALTVDTGFSGGLVAVSMGMTSMCDVKVHSQVQDACCMAPHLILHARHLISNFLTGLYSVQGRCLTFDASATGYSRGESLAAVVLKPIFDTVDDEYVEDEANKARRLGVLCGKGIVSSGATASLGSPSGPTEKEVVQLALSQGSIGPGDIDLVECHGDSKVLPDAIEVMALANVLRAEEDVNHPLMLTCAKTNQTHTCENMGMLALVRVFLSQRAGSVVPNQHLRLTNPYLDLEAQAVQMPAEALEYNLESAFVGTTVSSLGGLYVHVVAWGTADRGRVKSPPAPPPKRWTYFWPGGGGQLEAGGKPRKQYTIVGTWSKWMEPEPMKKVDDGVYVKTVMLGVNGWEQFRIMLDGDSNKVLHPGRAKAGKGGGIEGPDPLKDCEDFTWFLSGRRTIWVMPPEGGLRPPRMRSDLLTDGGDTSAQDDSAGAGAGPGYECVNASPEEQGRPGDLYLVRLRVAGKWRSVTWEKLAEGAPEAVDAVVPTKLGKYYIVASWNGWTFDDMESDQAAPNTFSRDVGPLQRDGGEFVIVRDKDWNQVLYPSDFADGGGSSEILGPDDEAGGRFWYLGGSAGDVFRIEFQRTVEPDSDVKRVSWGHVRHEQLPPEVLHAALMPKYFIIGSWDVAPRPREMVYDASMECFKFYVRRRPRQAEDSFQILSGGSWLSRLTPRFFNPQGGADFWWIRKTPTPRKASSAEEAPDVYEIRVMMRGGRPVQVTWSEYDQAAMRPPPDHTSSSQIQSYLFLGMSP